MKAISPGPPWGQLIFHQRLIRSRCLTRDGPGAGAMALKGRGRSPGNVHHERTPLREAHADTLQVRGNGVRIQPQGER